MSTGSSEMSRDAVAIAEFIASQGSPSGSRSFQAFMATLGEHSSEVVAMPTGKSPVAEGSRNTTLAHHAGQWLAKGLDIEEILRLAHEWNRHNLPPLEEDEVRRTCESIYRTHLRNYSEGGTGGSAPLISLEACRIERFLNAAPPPRRWLFSGFIPLGKVGIIVATGGTGKSTLLLQLAVSVALNIPLAGKWEVGETGAVLMLLAEDDDDEIHRRLNTTLNALALEGYAEQLAGLSDRLFIKSLVGINPLLTTKTLAGECVRTPLVDSLLSLTQGITNLKLIVIDPASRFRGGNENAAEDTTRFVEALEALAAAMGATVLIAHHVSKGGARADDASQHASRGSSALIDGVRWALQIAPPSKRAPLQSLDDFAELKRRTLVATVVKSNYGAIPEPTTLLRGEGGYLRHADSTAWAMIAQKTMQAEILKLLAHHDGKFSKAAFSKEFGGKDKALKVGIKQLESILGDMVKSGSIVVGPGKGRTLSISHQGEMQ